MSPRRCQAGPYPCPACEYAAEVDALAARVKELESRAGLTVKVANIGSDHQFDPDLIGGPCLVCGARGAETNWAACGDPILKRLR